MKNIQPKLSFTFPKPLSYFIIAIGFLIWLLFTSLTTKIRVFLASLVYGLIEFSFYATTIEMPNGDTIFKPFDPKCRKGHTVKKICFGF